MLKRKLGIGLFTALVLALSASQVFAGVTNFNVVVPRFGGGANSNVTTKNTNVQQWKVSNIVVGANKWLNVRPEKGNNVGVGSWNAVTTGSLVDAAYSPAQAIGTLIYLKITTNWTEPVSVQVTGTFNSR